MSRGCKFILGVFLLSTIMLLCSVVIYSFNVSNIELIVDNKKCGVLNIYKYNKDKKIKEPKKLGFTFAGWSTVKNGLTFIKEGDNLNNVRKLYGIFYKDKYKLTIDLNGGYYNNSNSNVFYKNLGYKQTYDLVKPSKEGQSFKYWKVVKGNAYIDDFSLIMGNSDSTIMAIYDKNI